MPRSDTSQVEQVLSFHPIIHGAGELPFTLNIAEFQKSSKPNKIQSHAVNFQNLNQCQIDKLAEQCLSDLLDLNPLAAHIIDKMPDNFFRLDNIGLQFQQDKIIHC